MSKIYLFLADGFETVEALAPVDVIRRAGLSLTTVSIMGRREVRSAQGVTVLADALFEECRFEDADYGDFSEYGLELSCPEAARAPRICQPRSLCVPSSCV